MFKRVQSLFLLVFFTAISSFLLAKPYFSQQLTGNNSMGGLAYMMIGTPLAIFATVIVFILYKIVIKFLYWEKLPLTTSIIVPLGINLLAANLVIVSAVIFSPMRAIEVASSDKYIKENIKLELASLQIIKQQHPVFPAKIEYVLKITNTGKEEKNYLLVINFGFFKKGDQRINLGDIAQDIVTIDIKPGKNFIKSEALVNSYIIRCWLDKKKFDEGLFLRYMFEGPGNVGIQYLPINEKDLYVPLLEMRSSVTDDGRKCL